MTDARPVTGAVAWYRDPITMAVALCSAGLAGILLFGLVQDIADPAAMQEDMRCSVGLFSPALPPPPPGPAEELLLYQRDRWRGSPPAYNAFMRVVARVADPWTVAKWGTLVVLAAVLIPMGLIGREIAGAAGVFALVGLACHTDWFVNHAAGTLVRAFVQPIVACTLYALLTGRDRLLFWIQPVAAAMYPPLLIVGGGSILARVVWGLRTGDVRAQWRRLLPHAAVALLVCVAALWPVARTLEDQRPFTYAEALELPELSWEGRGPLFAPFEPAWRTITRLASLGLTRQMPWHEARPLPLAALAVLAIGLAAARPHLPRRLFVAAACLAAGSLGGYVLARLLAYRLYAPDRYIGIAFPLLTTTLWLAAAVGIAARIRPGQRARAAGALAALLGAVAIGGPGQAGRTAFGVHVTTTQAVMLDVIRSLPPSVVVSGPPEFMDTVFARAHRYTYLSSEVLVPFHPGEWAWMKARYDRHIAAYYAADWAEVHALRNAGVTHLVVRKSDLAPVNPTADAIWHEPFAGEIADVRARNGPRGFLLAHPPAQAIVIQTTEHVLIDLARLP